MPNVYAWPPVSTAAYRHTINRPVQRVEGLLGSPYLSQAEPTRRLINAKVGGIGPDRASGGYVEMMKQLMDGQLPLVRITPAPRHWYRAARGLEGQRGTRPVTWWADDDELAWDDDGTTMFWTTGARITGTAGSDTWPYLDCTGLPPSRVVAFPAERLVVEGVGATRVLRLARSDAAGEARIYLQTALASGDVRIGEEESVVCEILQFPEAEQSVSGSYTYDFPMLEVFPSDVTTSFVEVDPWTS